MARFDFQSPGAAFAGEITDLLAQRKAEERQRMLDQLTVNADTRAQEVASRQGEEHKAQMLAMQQQQAAAAQQMELGKVGALGWGLDADDDLSGMAPEDLALMQKWGRVKNLPTTQVSTDVEFSTPEGEALEGGPVEAPVPAPPAQPRLGYVGTPEQRERQRLRSQSSNLIAGLMQNPKTAETGAFLAQLAQANDGLVPGDVMAQFLAPESPIGVFHEPTGQVTFGGKPASSMPSNAKVFSQGHAPYRAPRQWINGGIDPETGNTVLVDPNVVGPDGQPARIQIPNTAPRGANATSTALGIPQGLYEDHRDNMLVLQEDENGKVATANMRMFRQSANQLIREAKKASPMARELASTYVNDTANYDRLVREAAASGKLDDKTKTDLGALLDVVGTADLKDLFLANPVMRKTQPPRQRQGPARPATPSGPGSTISQLVQPSPERGY